MIKTISRRNSLLGLAASMPLWSTQSHAQAKADLIDQVASAPLIVTPDANALLQEQIESWKQASGFAARDGRDLVVKSAIAPVQELPSNPAWVKARTLAVSDAFLQAQADYINSQLQSIQTSTVSEFTKGPDTPPDYKTEFQSAGAAAEIIRKILAVANGQLDEQLRSLGVDPQKYQSLPEAQKSDLLRNQLKMTVVRRAFSSIAGMLIVKTFEGYDDAQHYEMGIVAIASTKLTEFSRRVISSRGQFPPEPARAGDLTRFYKDPSQLIHDFGVRQCFDEQGLPVILSFAQWGSAYRGADAALAANYRNAARAQAEALADGQIADFLKGSAQSTSSNAAGQDISSVASMLPDSGMIQDSHQIIDEMKRVIKRQANVQVSGIRTLYSWTGKHPASPAPIQGVIRIWSAASEQHMRSIMNVGKPQRSEALPSPAKNSSAGINSSRQLMDVSDF